MCHHIIHANYKNRNDCNDSEGDIFWFKSVNCVLLVKEVMVVQGGIKFDLHCTTDIYTALAALAIAKERS